jgi:LAGLIDADG DNA endonuclease family
MDDGSTYRKSNGDTGTYILNSQSYTYSEQKRLVKALNSVFKLHANIHQDGKHYKLYIQAQSKDLFEDIISPYILPSFHYKL